MTQNTQYDNIVIENPQSKGRIRPNSTMISNFFLDNMYLYSGNEVKVFAFISRKTDGYHDASHKFTISYIIQGTGIYSEGTVIKATKKLLNDGWIVREKIPCANGYTYQYSLADEIDLDFVREANIKGVQKMQGCKNYRASSSKNTEQALQFLKINKETSIKKQFKETNIYTGVDLEKSNEEGKSIALFQEEEAKSKEEYEKDPDNILGKDLYGKFLSFIKTYNEIMEKKYKGDKGSKGNFKSLMRQEYIQDDVETAIKNLKRSLRHMECGYATPEFITRPNQFEKWLNITSAQIETLNKDYRKSQGSGKQLANKYRSDDENRYKDIFSMQAK